MKEIVFTEPVGGDQSQGWAILAVCWAFVTAAVVTTLLRIFVRTRLTRNVGSDDWVMVACLVSLVILWWMQHCADRKQDHNHHGRWTGELRSARWGSGSSFVLPNFCAKEKFRSSWLGRLDSDLRHTRADEDLNMPLPHAYRGCQTFSDDPLGGDWLYDLVHKRICLLVHWRL